MMRRSRDSGNDLCGLRAAVDAEKDRRIRLRYGRCRGAARRPIASLPQVEPSTRPVNRPPDVDPAERRDGRLIGGS